MQAAAHYIRLRQSVRELAEGQEWKVTLEELADILFCTVRNAKLVLKKMSELQWIIWSPGRGRGNVSTLTFLARLEEICLQEAKELVMKGNLKEAWEWMNEISLDIGAKEQFMAWLSGYFGVHKAPYRDECIETLRVPLYKTMTTPVTTLDPAYLFFSAEEHIARHVFETLVLFNKETENLEPNLAYYWEASERADKWTVYLRKGVRFHHGRVMTSADVKFTLERLKRLSPVSPSRWLVQNIREMHLLGSHAIQICLTEPNYLFMYFLGSASTMILPADVYSKDIPHHGEQRHIGTGSFKLARHDESMLVLEAFEDYFKERALLDRIEMWILPKECALEKPGFWEYLAFDHNREGNWEAFSGWAEIRTELSGCSMLTFNMNKPGPQQDLRFRQAMHWMIDRRSLLERLEGNRLRPASGLLPKSTGIAEQEMYCAATDRLLSDSGYQGETISLYIYKRHEKDAEVIKEQCALGGVNVDITVLSEKEMTRLETIRQADMILFETALCDNTLLGLLSVYKDETSFVRVHMDSELRDEIDGLIDSIMKDPLAMNRYQKMEALEAKLKEHVSVLFLLHKMAKSVFHPALKGIAMSAMGWVDFRKLWFEFDPDCFPDYEM